MGRADAEGPRRRRRLTPFRVVLLLLLLVVAAVAWSAYSVYRAQSEIRAADDAYDDLSAAFAAGDRGARDAALAELRAQAGAARDRTDSPWWDLMTRAPRVGDDLDGVRHLAAAFDTVARDGLGPVFEVTDALEDEGLAEAGTVHVDLLASFDDPVRRARDAFARAGDELAEGDPAGFGGALRDPYDSQVTQFAGLERTLTTAARATRVLPRMLGAEGARDYLLVLQDNATIRPSGGRPVSWARVRADAGRVTVEDQGGPRDFPAGTPDGVELTADERALYGPTLGSDFADAGLTPDFPRTAEIWAAHYAELRPGVELAGVVSLDPVTLSGVLQAIGEVGVNGLVLRPGNVVGVLESDVHRRLDADQQDDAYAVAVDRLLAAVTGAAPGSYDLVKMLALATDQGRVRVAALDPADAADLAGSEVLGHVRGAGSPEGGSGEGSSEQSGVGSTPRVDVTLADATGGAMSYYLRHDVVVRSTGCAGGRQQLAGTLTLGQSIPAVEAAELPATVTGATGSRGSTGAGGVRAGEQAVVVRLYAPDGGQVDSLRVDDADQPVRLFGGDERPTTALRVVVTGPTPVVVTWTMTAGPGQTGAGRVEVTPGVEPVDRSSTWRSACD